MKPWQEIGGWFSERDAIVNDIIARGTKDGETIVTVGVWHGRSLASLWDRLRRFNRRNVRMVGVDLFPDGMIEIARAELADRPGIELVQSASVSAASEFAAQSLRAVFIDAGHEYEDVKADIAAWRGKVMPGGLMCGHDYGTDWPGVDRAVCEALDPCPSVGSVWLYRVPVPE